MIEFFRPYHNVTGKRFNTFIISHDFMWKFGVVEPLRPSFLTTDKKQAPDNISGASLRCLCLLAQAVGRFKRDLYIVHLRFHKASSALDIAWVLGR